MIDFYAWNTPNGQKIAIMLEELIVPYQIHTIDITKEEQFDPEFLKISPNNKIPAIIDQDGPGDIPLSIFESGAIMIYLGEKFKQLLPAPPIQKINCMEWLMFQMASIGPMFGQLNHFLLYAKEKVPYAIERYGKEVKRLYRVMDLHLSKNHYFALEYSIADIAIFPWVNIYASQQIDLNDYPHVLTWHEEIAQRQAVVSGLQKLQDACQKSP